VRRLGASFIDFSGPKKEKREVGDVSSKESWVATGDSFLQFSKMLYRGEGRRRFLIDEIIARSGA